MMGTPYYMSPEQCAGSELTPAADQYSLAVMAFQALSGRLPFAGDTAVDIIKRHCFDPPPSILTLRPDLPAPLAAVIDRALAKPAADRFPSVEAFAQAFARAARGEAVPEARVRVTRRAFAARARMPYVAGGLAGIALVVAVLWRPWSEPVPAAAATPTPAPALGESVVTPAAPPPVAQRKPEPAPAPAAAPVASGYLTVGSTPQARLSVNGTVVPTNPVYRYRVPDGTVQLRFTVTDSAGAWSYDTTVAVAPNETRNIGRVRLVRP